MIALANEVDHLKRNHYSIDRDVQEMSELINSVNNRFSPCLSVGPFLASQLVQLSTVVAKHGQFLYTTKLQVNQANNVGAHTS